MPTFAEGLADMLRAGRFLEITPDQWETILMSIIVDDLEASAAHKREMPPAWTQGVPRVHFTITLRLPTRDSGEIEAATGFFRDTLPTTARLTLSDALTHFVQNAYWHLKEIGYDESNSLYEQTKFLAEQGLMISGLLDGAVRADVLEEIALDPKFPNRRAAVGNLLRQNFRNSVNPSLWRILEGQVSWAPELTPYVMHQYLDDRREFEALRVLKHVPKDPGGNVVRLIERALKKSRPTTGWADHVRHIFGELPPWVLEMVRKEVRLDPIFQEVIDLLETSKV